MAKLVPWNKTPLKNGDIPVAIISLEDAESRRSTLIERGFTADLVDGYWKACDMRGLPESDLQSYGPYHDIRRIYGRPPISAEIGCFFSHSRVIQWFSKQDAASQLVVFEDDVIPENLESLELLTKLASALSEPSSSGKPFICHLGPRSQQWSRAFARRISRKGIDLNAVTLFELTDKKAGLWRAHAYLISKESAVRYTELVEKTGFLADDWRFISSQTESTTLLIDPPLFGQDEVTESTIDPRNERSRINGELGSRAKNLEPTIGSLIQVSRKFFGFAKRFIKILAVKFYQAWPGKKLY